MSDMAINSDLFMEAKQEQLPWFKNVKISMLLNHDTLCLITRNSYCLRPVM